MFWEKFMYDFGRICLVLTEVEAKHKGADVCYVCVLRSVRM